ncbi:ATP-binding protein [Myxococcus sp. CA040A]|uniref:ATP-binding protein n=1 Tax=Myxococcus sp. CA040A TaxID=2741738 RepID=UPI00157A3284|nr:ATP-binding protein [Myxococcus sp. CA040A]NTX01822.1 ATP-binding protein [Myxococcus sp. CA040A]
MSDNDKPSRPQGTRAPWEDGPRRAPTSNGTATRPGPAPRGPASNLPPTFSTSRASQYGGPDPRDLRPPPSARENGPPRREAPPTAPPPRGPEARRNDVIRPTPPETLEELDALKSEAKPASPEEAELLKAVAFTHFDTASSEDNLVTLLLTRADLHLLASQTLVRIKSREDQRTYLGVVVRGPFAEPNAVAANSPMAIGVVTQGKRVTYTFDYHGRAEVELLGEEIEGALKPPRFRPRPQSPVFRLDEEESARVLGVGGDLCLGVVVGYEKMEARLNPRDKAILPRHTGIIGTTGGGKSTTVATLLHRAQSQGIATIVFDVEGEYTHVDRPTDHAAMLEALRRRGLKAEGVRDLHIHHLTGRASLNPRHRNLHGFSLGFSSLSPYALAEILDMSDAQQERFLKAYDVTKLLLEDFGIFPTSPDEQRQALDVDELSTGYPKMTIQHLLDVVSAYIYSLSDEGRADTKGRARGPSRKDAGTEDLFAAEEAPPRGPSLYSEFRGNPGRVMNRVMAQSSKHEISWKALASKLHRLRRLNIFDVGNVPKVDYGAMLTAGRVSVIDLSDTDSPQLNNLVIADILRGIQETQEARYARANAHAQDVTPVLIVIEEAHEFLSASRISQMPVLFEQVARIAKRGRKRWLSLVFVTQLPQHLPNEVLGLLNNFIIHKITDSSVISRMQRAVGGIDESLWNRVSRLAPGQALVSFTNFTRPLMVAVDPAPVKRMLVE